MIVRGTFSFNCNNCNTNYSYSDDEATFEILEVEERSQSRENLHGWHFEQDCDCGEEIEVKYDVWEYPLGTENTVDIEIDNGTEISRYEHEFMRE